MKLKTRRKLPKRIVLGPRALDLTGHSFTRLRVLRPVDRSPNGQIIWFCQCSCGSFIRVRAGDLKSGNTKSCGCYNLGRVAQMGRANRDSGRGRPKKGFNTHRIYGEIVELYLEDHRGRIVASTVIDVDDLDLVSRYRWGRKLEHRTGKYYVVSRVLRGTAKHPSGVWVQVALHRLIAGDNIPSHHEVDHIDRDPLNNRRNNLRVVTHGENMLNRADYGSIAEGISVNSKSGEYSAQIYVNGVKEILGVFSSPDMASKAYNNAAKKYFG